MVPLDPGPRPEVFFLTGTDEHGQKVEQSAEKAGVTPLAFADDVSPAPATRAMLTARLTLQVRVINYQRGPVSSRAYYFLRE